MSTSKLDILEAQSTLAQPGFQLFRLNGVGAVFGGALRDPDLGRYHLQSIWFTVLFIPVYLVGVYLASSPVVNGKPDTDRIFIYRKIKLTGLRGAYGSAWGPRIVASSAWKYAKSAGWVVGVILALVLLVGLPMASWLDSTR